MYTTLTTLIDRLDSFQVSNSKVIPWGCPVPSFGDVLSSRVASLGLNPSNREFVDESGSELEGAARRFHTLKSLGIDSWSDVDARHLQMISESCAKYFKGNPYDRWFKRLDQVVAGTGTSYYDYSRTACHLDLIPYATERKWTALTVQERCTLMEIAGDTLALVLRESPVEMLILNGRSVVEHFQEIAGIRLEERKMIEWSLPRESKPDVMGIAYSGEIDALSGIFLGRSIRVLGFNHNLQSSFGVTNSAVQAIRRWIHRLCGATRK